MVWSFKVSCIFSKTFFIDYAFPNAILVAASGSEDRSSTNLSQSQLDEHLPPPPATSPPSNSNSSPSTTTSTTTTTSTATPIEQLIVNATSKTVRLPFNEVTLSAFAMPDPSPDVDPGGYSYEWKLVAGGPPGDDKGVISDVQKATLRLSNLKPGVYSFVVSVKGSHSFGEASANLTVLPREHLHSL
jgi:hypothetical protein